MQHSNSTVQFQFSIENTNTNSIRYWDEKLKHKITELVNKPKQLFVALTGQKLYHWKIVYNPKTREFEKLELLSAFSNIDTDNVPPLFDDQKNELVFYDGRVLQLYSLEKHEKIEHFDASVSCMTWYTDKQTSKKYLIIGNWLGIYIIDWELKEMAPITPTWMIGIGIKSFLVDEEAQDLLVVSSYQYIGYWCLKTFISKQKCRTNGKILPGICYVDKAKTLFAICNENQIIEIWNKQTGSCVLTRTRDDFGPYNLLLYSVELDLLISCSQLVECWKLKNESQLEFDKNHDFKIDDVYGKRMRILYAQFLDKRQAQLLVCDVEGRFFCF